MVVLSFHVLKTWIISARESWWWSGDDSVADTFLISDKYDFSREDKGNLLRSAVPSNNVFLKGVKLSFPNKYLSGLIVNGLPWACEKCARLREIRHLSMSSGSSTFSHWSSGRDEGILFQDMGLSIGILIYLMPLDLLWWVWCFMRRWIYCWCSIIIRLNKYINISWYRLSLLLVFFSFK